ncbi:yippee protein, putative [Perkinsus marinus ATCC 50983]|uniref:Yippee protein, putative n=1 Tax=Perkinsus marinus (strain ATCC 50983 / TXsc) TaxID=423536 RepID=C5LAP2_PERM5|nr:yippee protein, putative [Perkinsus marinus ATCC 50983]EER06201.1 yippee protein, putative [Perkinsus marinus ATCC 50983]|eukprot:XP_002774385.1 yippee protein, putative [Perkinsus marinus ATCC 50983]
MVNHMCGDKTEEIRGSFNGFCILLSQVRSNFRGRTGAALLLESLVNVVLGPQEDTIMTTGMHSIRVCFCIKCLENIGWTYEEAFEDDQKYKEHRYG